MGPHDAEGCRLVGCETQRNQDDLKFNSLESASADKVRLRWSRRPVPHATAPHVPPTVALSTARWYRLHHDAIVKREARKAKAATRTSQGLARDARVGCQWGTTAHQRRGGVGTEARE